MNIAGFVQISIGAILINNFVLSRCLGLCPFFNASKKLPGAIGMGMAVIFAMTFASMFTWIISEFILIPYDVCYLQTIVFILVIVFLVQLVEITLKKFSTFLYNAIGIFLPHTIANCAILGVAILNTGENVYTGQTFTFIECIVNGIMSGVGFTLVLVLMAGIREKLDLVNIPKPLEGLPIAFITAALMAIAFLGFSGLNSFQSIGG